MVPKVEKNPTKKKPVVEKSLIVKKKTPSKANKELLKEASDKKWIIT